MSNHGPLVALRVEGLPSAIAWRCITNSSTEPHFCAQNTGVLLPVRLRSALIGQSINERFLTWHKALKILDSPDNYLRNRSAPS